MKRKSFHSLTKEGRHRSERGTGAGEVLAYIVAFSVVWAVFYWVTDWIYNTKEEKVEHRYSRAQDRYESEMDKKYVVREPGGSTAYCWGLFHKNCETIFDTKRGYSFR